MRDDPDLKNCFNKQILLTFLKCVMVEGHLQRVWLTGEEIQNIDDRFTLWFVGQEDDGIEIWCERDVET